MSGAESINLMFKTEFGNTLLIDVNSDKGAEKIIKSKSQNLMVKL